VGGAGHEGAQPAATLGLLEPGCGGEQVYGALQVVLISSPVIPLTAGLSEPGTVGTVSHRRDLRGDTQRDARASDECQQQDPRHIHRRGKARSKQCVAKAGYR